METETTQLF